MKPAIVVSSSGSGVLCPDFSPEKDFCSILVESDRRVGICISLSLVLKRTFFRLSSNETSLR